MFREQHVHTFQKADYRLVALSAIKGEPQVSGRAEKER